MKLEVGKRYVRRDGKVTGPLKSPTQLSYHEYIDPEEEWGYLLDGRIFRDENHPEDIVREYTEEKPVKKPLQVGNRVKVYSEKGVYVFTVFQVRPYEPAIVVLDGNGFEQIYYSQQCRRLVKKKKPKLREWWVEIDKQGCIASNQPRHEHIGPCFDGAILIREVRKKK